MCNNVRNVNYCFASLTEDLKSDDYLKKEWLVSVSDLLRLRERVVSQDYKK